MRRADRWRDVFISEYAPAVERLRPTQVRRIWGRALGLAIALLVSAGGWTLVGIALSHLLR